MRVHYVLHAAVFVGVCIGHTELLKAQTSVPSKECSPVLENRADCKSTITTYKGSSGLSSSSANTAVAAQASNSPVAVRAIPKVKVTVVVHKRPLELIQSQLTCNQVAKPDVLGTLVGKLAQPLGGLTVWNKLAAPPPIAPAEIDLTKPPPPPPPKPPAQQAFEKTLNDLAQHQQDALDSINAQNKVMADVTLEISAAQRYAPALSFPGDAWQLADITQFRACLTHIIDRVSGGNPNEVPAQSCETVDASVSTIRNTGLQVLPSADVASAGNQVSQLPKQLDALKAQVALSPGDLQTYKDRLNQLSDNQDVLTGALKTVQATRATLAGYGQALADWKKSWPTDSDLLVTQAFPISCDAPASGQATGSAKLTAQTLLTKDSRDAGTVAVTWAHQPWEVSGGIMYSTVLGRSFQNSPVINNGLVVLDPNGKPLNELTQSTTKPTIDALVLVHWRFYERQMSATRRFAVLGSVGVGTGANGSGADFAAGMSFAFGNFFLSPLLHFTRDLRLTNGVALGQNLIGQSPPTERYWVHKFGLALTYAVPIT